MRKRGKDALQHAFLRFSAISVVFSINSDTIWRIYFTISSNSTSNFRTLFGLISGPAARSP